MLRGNVSQWEANSQSTRHTHQRQRSEAHTGRQARRAEWAESGRRGGAARAESRTPHTHAADTHAAHARTHARTRNQAHRAGTGAEDAQPRAERKGVLRERRRLQSVGLGSDRQPASPSQVKSQGGHGKEARPGISKDEETRRRPQPAASEALPHPHRTSPTRAPPGSLLIARGRTRGTDLRGHLWPQDLVARAVRPGSWAAFAPSLLLVAFHR